MKKIIISTGIALFALCGCQSKAGTGIVAGGAVGATTGAIVGGGQGALIGGAIGVIGGGLIGAALDEQDRQNLQSQSPKTLDRIDRQQQLTVYDIKEMTRAGINDDVIMTQIDQTRSRFYLSTADIIDLKNAGVSQKVINFMIQTGGR